VWSIGGYLFIHSLDEVKGWDFIIIFGFAIASHIMKINMVILSIDIVDPIEEIKFHVVYASG